MKLVNDPDRFRDEFYEGFLAAHSDTLTGVPDSYGVLRADWAEQLPRVAVLIGGGSGHYPTRCGLVGPGLADIAVVGNTFASPPAQHILRCTRAVDKGHGVIYLYGNYSGDRLNFTMAADEAQEEGIAIRQVIGCDDVASAPAGSETDRRGIAGDFYLFKVAAAAAQRGDDLDAVATVTERANAWTRSFGVAFDGCTLPGQAAPLFSVEPGMMDIGLGIHGEPGISTVPLLPADGIADLLVQKLLADAPAGAPAKVAVLVNSLGRTSDEELFVLYRRIAEVLAGEGVEIHHSIVGSLTTSLDMEGCSLSLLWLDDELEALYDTPASGPAYTHRMRS